MRVASILPGSWQLSHEERKSTWHKLFSRSHRHTISKASTNDSFEDICMGTPSLVHSSVAGSTRSATPELPDVSSPLPPMIPRKSSQRLKRMSMVSDINTTSMYPEPLSIPKRPSTSSSVSSPTSMTSDWSQSGFSSNHPALSPLGDRDRPASIFSFSQRDYEPTIYEEPEYIRIQDENQLILTVTSKYPTGVAAELYVPVDCSLPPRPRMSRRISEKVRPRSIIGDHSALRSSRPKSMYHF